MPNYRTFIFISLCLLWQAAIGQVVEPVKVLTGQSEYRADLARQTVTALAIVADHPIIATVQLDSAFFELELDPDAPAFTYFLSLSQARHYRDLRLSVSDASASIYFINSGATPAIRVNATGRTDNDCDESPDVILQSEWRSGLDAPDYNRSFHDVSHIIVHHSAGSNSASNFTQVVRDIYLYHTQVNGWSDIGYNYLIAQDGTIYAGRDPGSGQQNLVRGAHFCGANTGTMGICLLGNFETAEPSAASIQSLTSMLTYQSSLLALNPLEESQHSTGNLGHVAGHRDGCATLCPGENVYTQLTQIRADVFAAQVQCDGGEELNFSFNHEILGVNQPLTLTNLSTGYAHYLWLIDGKVLMESQNEYIFDTPGSYDLGLIGSSPNRTDTLLFPNAVRVSWLTQEPIVFPNPSTGRTFTIDYPAGVEKVTLRDLTGKVIYTSLMESEISLPPSVKGGLYQLEILTLDSQTKTSRLLIQ